jgi:predicted acyl esterase
MFRISVVAVLVAALFTAAGGATASPHSTHAGLRPATAGSPAAGHTKFKARGSVQQVDVTGAGAHKRVVLLNRAGHRVAVQKSSGLGAVLFRHVKPGKGYRVQILPHGPRSKPVTVHNGRAKPWDPKIYHQSIPDHGYTYLKTRDGTKLAIDVHPPSQPASLGTPPVVLPPGPDYAPPYPTLIEYSGYGYANPDGPVNGIAVLANIMGFAVVDVNMRGTGCSGGAFDFFEKLQTLDGYDVIQTIAHQPWVLNHKVGMMGISYGAISQLFTAQTHPPALEAISPLSTIDATATTLYPGGNLNTGFAVAWAKERQHEAKPAGPHGGQPYAYQQIKDGDKTCARNQELHSEAANLDAKIAANSHYRPKIADALDPITFVHKIHVPVFMACQFEDEQTGGHCPALVSHFSGTKKKWFTFTNGAHIDSLDPETYNRWYDFLELYVAHQAPAQNVAVTDAGAPVIYQQAMGLPQDDSVTMPPDPIQQMPSYSAAKAAFDKLPSVRVLFDNGAGSAPPGGTDAAGNPYPGFERSYARFPAPHTSAKKWYLGPHGALTDHRTKKRGIDRYTSNPKALPKTDFGKDTGGGGLWGNASQWEWKWRHNPSGTAVSYLTVPLKHDTTVFGAGALHLWVRSSTPDVDLQATISEVTPDGNETFVQNGWMRASERKLAHGKHTIFAQKSSLLEPIPSERAADVRPMPKGKFVKVVVPLYYEGHAYRAGTRIRVTIAGPNGTQPIWSFNKPVPRGKSKVSVAFSRKQPSSLVLPVVPGSIPTEQPACPSLRNEPCRSYQPLTNRTSAH